MPSPRQLVREVVGALLRGDLDLVEDRTHPYLRDCYDHAVQIMDTLENFRDPSLRES